MKIIEFIRVKRQRIQVQRLAVTIIYIYIYCVCDCETVHACVCVYYQNGMKRYKSKAMTTEVVGFNKDPAAGILVVNVKGLRVISYINNTIVIKKISSGHKLFCLAV